MTTETVSKQEAAKRLIHAAVAMFKTDSDPLAMHVVASSALNLLRELSKVDGALFIERVFQQALFDAAVKKLDGLETELPNDPVVNAWVKGLADAIASGGVKSPADIRIKDPLKFEVDMLKYLVKPFNFLKHADKDPQGSLDVGEVNPIEATGFAVTAYTLLFPSDELDEGVKEFLQRHGILQ